MRTIYYYFGTCESAIIHIYVILHDQTVKCGAFIFVFITPDRFICHFLGIAFPLRWSLRVFQGCQDSYDLSECHGLYGLDRHNEPNHTDRASHSDHSF